MTRLLRIGLLVAGALAACLAVLWACVVLGLWLALHPAAGGPGPDPTRVATAAALVLNSWLLVRATRLLAADLRDPERQR